jgi:hypothetical protein
MNRRIFTLGAVLLASVCDTPIYGRINARQAVP